MLMRRRRFEALVREALTTLPPDLRRLMDNVEIVVEDWPTDEDLAAAGLGPDETLFGLYLGVPLTERDSGYAGALPDKIAIYRFPLEDEFGDDPAVLEEEIRITVIHEIAHHFGIDEERLGELGWS